MFFFFTSLKYRSTWPSPRDRRTLRYPGDWTCINKKKFKFHTQNRLTFSVILRTYVCLQKPPDILMISTNQRCDIKSGIMRATLTRGSRFKLPSPFRNFTEGENLIEPNHTAIMSISHLVHRFGFYVSKHLPTPFEKLREKVSAVPKSCCYRIIDIKISRDIPYIR